MGQAHGPRRADRGPTISRSPWRRRRKARVIGLVPGPDHHRVPRGGAHGRRRASRSPTRRATSRRSPSSSGTSRPGGSASASSAGFGLKRGAVGSTVAHDAHNMIVVGADDASMLAAARRLRDLGGGLVVADGDRVLAELPLPVAGLLSDRPLAEVLDASRELAARRPRARRHLPAARPDARVPLAVGDPVAEDHRSGARRRRALRARAAGGLTTRRRSPEAPASGRAMYERSTRPTSPRTTECCSAGARCMRRLAPAQHTGLAEGDPGRGRVPTSAACEPGRVTRGRPRSGPCFPTGRSRPTSADGSPAASTGSRKIETRSPGGRTAAARPDILRPQFETGRALLPPGRARRPAPPSTGHPWRVVLVEPERVVALRQVVVDENRGRRAAERPA